MTRRAKLGAAALAALAATVPVALAAAPASPPVKQWVLENVCDWWLSGPNGKELHASIGQGDDNPVLTVSDRAFLPFSEEERVPVTLRFDGNPKRESRASGWVSSVVGDGQRMLGLFLNAPARRAMGGARQIQIFHRGKLLVDFPLANTPTRAQLDKCTRPKDQKGDSE